MNIISISGLIGSGKDTAADYMVKQYGYTKLSFASTLKDVLSSMFSWPRELLEGSTAESRIWRDNVDIWWASKLGIPEFSPRWALENIGTNLFRNHFHTDIWVSILERKLVDKTVIADCRFENEFQMLKNNSAFCVQIVRETPVWVKEIKLAQSPDEYANLHDIHETRWRSLFFNYDKIIQNTSSMDNLHHQLDIMMT